MRGTRSIAKDVTPASRSGHHLALRTHRQGRDRRGARTKPTDPVGRQWLHRHDHLGVTERSLVEDRTGLDVLLVGDQRLPSSPRLDGDLVAEPDQLRDQLGHQRDALLARAGLSGHRDPHPSQPRASHPEPDLGGPDPVRTVVG